MENRTKVGLITGGSQGMGFVAARKLAKLGYRLIVTSRQAQKAEEAAAKLNQAVTGAQVRGMALDLSSLQSVAEFVKNLSEQEQSLHLLIANAAYWPNSKVPAWTSDGFEMTFGTNHLGHFRLVNGLLPLLQRGAKEADEARIVVVSSRLHLPRSMGPDTRFDFDDPNLRGNYEPMVSYKNSKLANIWFAYELNRRITGSGVTVTALCPGFVPETQAAYSQGLRKFFFKYVMPRFPFATTANAATETYVYVATEPSLKGVGGKFYGEKKEIASSEESYDVVKAARLWQLSEELIAGKQLPS
jgi:retinol dehydrogenase 12